MSEQKEKEKVVHGPITAEKFAKNVWVAKCEVTKPLKTTVTMRGNSEQNCKDKLKNFLTGKPYKDL